LSPGLSEIVLFQEPFLTTRYSNPSPHGVKTAFPHRKAVEIFYPPWYHDKIEIERLARFPPRRHSAPNPLNES